MAAEDVEWFPSTGATVPAVVGFGLVAVVVVYAVAVPGSVSLPVVTGALFGAVLMWATLVRPRVGITPDTLVLRGAFRTVRLPLAAIQHAAVRRMLVVFAGERRFTAVALSRSRRTLYKRDRQPVGERTPLVDAVDYAEDRILALADDARRRAGVKPKSRKQRELAADAETVWAWPEITLAAMAGGVFLVTLLWSLAR